MNTHTDELKSREITKTNNPSEEEMDENGLEEDQEDPTFIIMLKCYTRKIQ